MAKKRQKRREKRPRKGTSTRDPVNRVEEDQSHPVRAESDLVKLSQGRATQSLRQVTLQRLQQAHGNDYVQHVMRLLEPLSSNFQVLNRQEKDEKGKKAKGVAYEDIKGDPTAKPDPGTSTHPTLKYGSKGPAVEELQQKLNADGATPPLVVDGIFGPKTRAAVVSFQKKYKLLVDGIVGPQTWGKIDELGLASTVGRVEKTWTEEVGGQEYGMTSRYTWRILEAEIRVTVKLKFVGVKNTAKIAQAFDAIRRTWNKYKAVNSTTGKSYNIVFDPQAVQSGQDNIVRLRKGKKRSDAENWYLGDPDFDSMAAHEFGHMIGLEDEYQRSHRDYKRLTGKEPPTGQKTEDMISEPAEVAKEMYTALRIKNKKARVAAAKNVVLLNGLQQGQYAQDIAAAYLKAYKVGIIKDIVDRIPDEDEWDIVDPFTYSTETIMGDYPSKPVSGHTHPVEPRHVREYVGYLKAAKPGKYTVEAK